jgi:dUTP pyrophosphatase
MLNIEEIRRLIEDQGLIREYVDLETQLQPSGFDLSLKEVREFSGSGSADFSNEERVRQLRRTMTDGTGYPLAATP